MFHVWTRHSLSLFPRQKRYHTQKFCQTPSQCFFAYKSNNSKLTLKSRSTITYTAAAICLLGGMRQLRKSLLWFSRVTWTTTQADWLRMMTPAMQMSRLCVTLLASYADDDKKFYQKLFPHRCSGDLPLCVIETCDNGTLRVIKISFALHRRRSAVHTKSAELKTRTRAISEGTKNLEIWLSWGREAWSVKKMTKTVDGFSN